MRQGSHYSPWRCLLRSNLTGQQPATNQLTFHVFRTHQGSQQTIIGKPLRVLSLHDIRHSMLYKKRQIWAPKRSNPTPALCNLPAHVSQLVALAMSSQHICSKFSASQEPGCSEQIANSTAWLMHEMRMHDVAQGPCLQTQTCPQCRNAILRRLDFHCTLDNSELTLRRFGIAKSKPSMCT